MQVQEGGSKGWGRAASPDEGGNIWLLSRALEPKVGEEWGLLEALGSALGPTLRWGAEPREPEAAFLLPLIWVKV